MTATVLLIQSSSSSSSTNDESATTSVTANTSTPPPQPPPTPIVERRKKKPYKELTLEEKVQLIRLAEENAGLSQACIAERYEIAKSNVCRILQRKEEYLRAFESAGFSGSRKRKLRSDVDSAIGDRRPVHQTSSSSPPSSSSSSSSRSSSGSSTIEIADINGHLLHRNGNETLRAHMYKQHQISRMFMCRCCNWAFPDKTSLHMHMQAKEEGKNINVPIIGKGGAGNQFGPMSMNVVAAAAAAAAAASANASAGVNHHHHHNVHQQQQQQHQTSMNDANALSGANIFPPLSMVQQRGEDLMAKLRERFMLNTMVAQSGFNGFNLAAWLANFPRVDASGVGRLGGSLNLRLEEKNGDDMMMMNGGASSVTSMMKQDESDSGSKSMSEIKMENDSTNACGGGSGNCAGDCNGNGGGTESMEDDDQVIVSDDVDHNEIEASDSTSDDQKETGSASSHNSDEQPASTITNGCFIGNGGGGSMPALRSAINSSPLNSLLYKKRLDTALRRKNLEHALMNLSEHAQETRDASHVSPSETHSSASPPPIESTTCYECSVFKGKLAVAHNRCRYLEGRTATLQTDALRFSTRASVSETNSRQYEQEARLVRDQNEILQRKLLECQEKTLNFLQGDKQNSAKAVSIFLNDILQTTFLR